MGILVLHIAGGMGGNLLPLNLSGTKQVCADVHKMTCDAVGCQQPRYDVIANGANSMRVKAGRQTDLNETSSPARPFSHWMGGNRLEMSYRRDPHGRPYGASARARLKGARA